MSSRDIRVASLAWWWWHPFKFNSFFCSMFRRSSTAWATRAPKHTRTRRYFSLMSVASTQETNKDLMAIEELGGVHVKWQRRFRNNFRFGLVWRTAAQYCVCTGTVVAKIWAGGVANYLNVQLGTCSGTAVGHSQDSYSTSRTRRLESWILWSHGIMGLVVWQ